MAKRKATTRRRGSTSGGKPAAWKALNEQIINCEACPRLIEYIHRVAEEKRKAFLDWEYWGAPVPNFGDPRAKMLIVGLAPAAHGANRTGRMFTGDRSGDWLYRAMAKAGFANQAEATHMDDGLTLKNCAITAVCHCAPPDNKPAKEEVAACATHLSATIDLLQPRVFLCLGQIGWKAAVNQLAERDWLLPGEDGKLRKPKFGHGAEVQLAGKRHLLASYHPSQQNTFTGRLTETMLDQVFSRATVLLQAKG